MELIKMELIKELENLKTNSKKLEVFGKITTSKKSWFKFVKYNENVLVDMYIENNKVAIFDTFDNAKNQVEKWLNTFL